MEPIISPGPQPTSSPDPIRSSDASYDTKHVALIKAAGEMETTFLAEMLKSAGFGKSRDAYGGGAGEDHFASLLVRAQAEQITRTGGIGLAEVFFTALLETENGRTIRAGSD